MCQDSSFQMLSAIQKVAQTPWWTDSEPDELAPIITEVQGIWRDVFEDLAVSKDLGSFRGHHDL